MSLKHGIEAAIKRALSGRSGADARFKRNVQIAADEMVRYVKEITPPPKGAERGVGTVTGNLSRHWVAKVSFSRKRVKRLAVRTCSVYLMNAMQYASYVNDGHRMDVHFVPWLRVNPGTGLLEKYTPDPGEPLFGIVVGTKTKYVKPTHMVQKARKHFFKTLNRLEGKQ